MHRLFLSIAAVATLPAVVCFAASRSCGAEKDKPAASEGKMLDQQLAAYQKLAAVFEAIEPTNVKGKRWVVVDAGPAGWDETVEGWLMEDGPDAVDIMDQSGYHQRFRKPRPGEQQPKPKEGQGLMLDELKSNKYRAAWHVQPKDFIARCRQRLKKGISEKEELPEGAMVLDQGRGHMAGIAIGASLDAYRAAQLGEKGLALELYTLATNACKKYADHFGGESTELPQFVAKEIATGRCYRAVTDAHSGAPRTDCLRQWETIARIPYHNHIDEAKRMVAGYKILIAEDAAWKEPAAAELAKLTTEQKINYWMYHLRDANVEQMSSPGMCEVVGWWSGLVPYKRDPKKPNPAAELNELGISVLPQIIEHLDDTRPTRCEGFWRWYSPDGYYLLCYDDCCQQIFERITGHSIVDRGYTNGYPIKDGKGKECKAAAEKWWREYERKGEQQMLIEGTEAGDSDEQARRLAAKYPQAALEPIIKVARRKKSVGLLLIAIGIKDDRVLPILQEELRSPDQDMRITAAQALMRRQKEEGFQTILKEWEQISLKEDSLSDAGWAAGTLVSGLAESGELAAIQALVTGFRKGSPTLRLQIVKSCGGREKDWRGRPLTPAAQAAIDEFLVQALSDTEEESSVESGPDGKEVRDPAIGDVAAEILVVRWGKPELFDRFGYLGVRERQRLEIKNLWLRKSGRQPVEVPALPKVVPMPDDKVGPLLEAVRSATTPDARRAPLESLTKLGLPTLPAIRKFLQTLNPDHPARAALEDLARRAALTISEVRFAAGPLKPSEDLRRRAEALRGNPVTRESFMDLLLSATKTSLPGARGIKIRVERLGDDRGASLIVAFVADKPPQKGLSPQLTSRQTIVVDREVIAGSGGCLAGIGQTVTLSDIDWKEFSAKLQVALQCRPEQYLLVRAECEEMR